MKIPETSANVGAYYGSEEHGQWQGNGVMVDGGVGGGVVGSGDAGFVPHAPHAPLYPAPRPLMPAPGGYVVTGAYFPAAYGAGPPPPPPQDDFADYMWMENEEEFDKQVMQQLEEEALMEQCIEAMLEDEQRERLQPVTNGHTTQPGSSNGVSGLSLEEAVSTSTLNPLAAEFVPVFARATSPPAPPTPSNDTKPTVVEVSAMEEVTKSEPPPVERKDSREVPAEEPPAETSADATPEVSAEDGTERRHSKDLKRDTKPKVVKAEPKVVKSEAKKVEQRPAKVAPKVARGARKEVRAVRSEPRVEAKSEADVVVPLAESAKSQPAVSEPLAASAAPAMKPINYAAAAKASKPRGAADKPADKTPSAPPRKNSAK